MSLKELLGEELYNQVMEKVGDNKIEIVSNGQWIPKQKFDDLNDSLKEYKQQLKSRDEQLEELKKIDAEGLQAKIQELQEANQRAEQEWQSKLQKQQFEFALKDALTAAKVRNPKAVKALLDTEVIKLDGDKLLGLDEQLKNIKESDPYLFEEEKPAEPKKPQFMTGQHYKGSGGIDATAFSQMTYKERLKLKQENPELYESLSGRK